MKKETRSLGEITFDRYYTNFLKNRGLISKDTFKEKINKLRNEEKRFKYRCQNQWEKFNDGKCTNGNILSFKVLPIPDLEII